MAKTILRSALAAALVVACWLTVPMSPVAQDLAVENPEEGHPRNPELELAERDLEHS